MDQDLKKLLSASGFELERVRTALSDNGIPNDSKPQKRNYSAKAVTGTDFTVQDIYVAETDYEKAYDLCVGIGAIHPEGDEVIVEEDPSAAEEEFEEMPAGKRTTVRIISALLFILIAAGVIFSIDAITGWIKGLFM